MPDTKTCPVCTKSFGRTGGISNDRWRQQKTCSRPCSALYRKRNHLNKQPPPQSRERLKAAMNRRWEALRADTARYGVAPAARLNREAEEAAIARFVAERGVTRAAPVESELIQARHEPSRPQPMAGWRG